MSDRLDPEMEKRLLTAAERAGVERTEPGEELDESAMEAIARAG